MKSVKRLQRYLSQRTATRPRSFSAIMGNLSGVVETGTPGFVYVMDRKGNEYRVYNTRVPSAYGLNVVVGFDLNSAVPHLLQVLEERDSHGDKPLPSIPDHSHEWGKTGNPAWIRVEQWLLGLPVPVVGETKIKVASFPYWLDGGLHQFIDTTIDLASEIPSSGANAVLVECDAAGVVTFSAGASLGSRLEIGYEDLPTPTLGLFPIVGLKVYFGQTEFIQTVDDTDFLDLRFARWSEGSGVGSFVESVTGLYVDNTDPFNPVVNIPAFVESVTGNAVDNTDPVHPVITLDDPWITAIARWSGAAGDDTFMLPDIASELQSVEINGLGQDPLTYSLSANGGSVLLDTSLAFDSVITAQYILEIL